MWCNRHKNYGHIFHQRLQVNTKQYFVFLFFENFHFNGHFRHFGRPYWIEDINGKRWFAITYKVIRWKTRYISLKKIWQKLKTWKCRKGKHQKTPFWCHCNKIFKKWEKSSQNLFQVVCVNFHQNRPTGVATKCCDKQTHRQSHRQTQKHTDRGHSRF